jgi:ABC-type Mn2+/Zn2+ transport system permease subunit
LSALSVLARLQEIGWGDRLELFHNQIVACFVAGLVCPLVGCWLLVRRTSFYGITLPQFATAGVVFGFMLLPWWIRTLGLGGMSIDEVLSDSHAAINYHLAWAAAFTFGGLSLLVWLGRRGSGSEIGRVAASFAIASAATVICGRLAPAGRSFVDELLSGEILGVGIHELEVLGAFYGLVLATLFVFRHDFLLVSFDRDLAHVLGLRVTWIELLLNGITGITVSVGTMTFGPLLLFGLLVVPPLAARQWARSMTSFLGLAALLGVVSVVGGVAASFELDLPLGAAIVGVSALTLLPRLLVSGSARARPD